MARRRAGIHQRVLQKKQPRQGEKTGMTTVLADVKYGQVYVHQRKMPMLHLFESTGFEIEKRLDAGSYELKMSFKRS